jgi:aldehyde:ferredoxin oxidoreductase
MNVWMGRGQRKDDWIPYRSMGPVTEIEYLSRKDRYDTYLQKKLNMKKEDIEKHTTQEKIDIIYQHRRNQYEKLTDAVYYRRGWTPNGVPTPQKIKSLGFTDNNMLTMLHNKIDEDEKNDLNKWGGNYQKNEKPPTQKQHYWKDW